MDGNEVRRRLNAELDEQRERVSRLDDSALTALVDHIRGLPPDPNFDSVGFLCSWILLPIPALGGITPAQAVAQDGGLSRVKQLLGQQVAGTFA